MESTFIAIGIVSLLSILTLRQDFAGAAGADSGSLVTVGKSLVAIHDWTFLLGPGFIVGVGNGLILGYLMYRSGLVPRGMALVGLIAGPVLCAAGIGVLLGAIEPGSVPQVIATAPEFVWELSLGIYLMVKGFKPSPITAETTAEPPPPPANSPLGSAWWVGHRTVTASVGRLSTEAGGGARRCDGTDSLDVAYSAASSQALRCDPPDRSGVVEGLRRPELQRFERFLGMARAAHAFDAVAGERRLFRRSPGRTLESTGPTARSS